MIHHKPHRLEGHAPLVFTLQNTRPPLFFFNDTATTEIYTLSLHDALPIFHRRLDAGEVRLAELVPFGHQEQSVGTVHGQIRSEEHTSELQSPCNIVCCLLLEKKKTSCVGSNFWSLSTSATL